MASYVASLRALADRYRRAEAEIVKAYFAQPRTEEQHIRWLKAQAFKEYSAIKPLLKITSSFYSHFDGDVDRHDFEEIVEKLAEETKHARLVMDLLEVIVGKKVRPRNLVWLPEDKKLARVRARYSKTYAALLHGSKIPNEKEMRRKDEELERAAVTLTEGGGGALYEVCVRLKEGTMEKKIATAFSEICRDEADHKNAGARNLAKLVRHREDFDRAAEIIRQVSSQRLRMRNEQFGFPLSEAKLRELDDRCSRSGTRRRSRRPVGKQTSLRRFRKDKKVLPRQKIEVLL